MQELRHRRHHHQQQHHRHYYPHWGRRHQATTTSCLVSECAVTCRRRRKCVRATKSICRYLYERPHMHFTPITRHHIATLHGLVFACTYIHI